MPSKSTQSKASRSASRHKANTIPKTKLLEHPHYLVVNTTLPSHIFSDRSLFTTYVPSRKSHKTVFGSNIIVEGIGDVHVQVFVSGKSILFCFRESWHVPSSPHHFFSCLATIPLGNQFMIASRSPQMIFSHKRRIAEPGLPKYMPFQRIDNLIVLKFRIPELSATSIQPTVTPFSLHASSSQPFAGLAALSKSLHPYPSLPSTLDISLKDQNVASGPTTTYGGDPDNWIKNDSFELDTLNLYSSLDNSFVFDGGSTPCTLVQQLSMHGGVCGLVDMVVDVVPLNESAEALMDMSVCLALDDTNVMSHGGDVCDDGLVGDDYSIGLKDDVNFTSHGGADDQMAPMDVMTDGDTKNQATYGGDPNNRLKADFLGTLNFSLNFFDLRVEDNFIVRLPTHSSSRTSSLSRSFTSILRINPPCFPHSSLLFLCKNYPSPFLSSVPSFSASILSGSSLPDSVLHLHATFSRVIWVEDSFILHSSTSFSPCISSLTSTLNSDNTTCLFYSSLSFSHNNFLLHFSPIPSFSTLILSPFSVYLHFEVSSLPSMTFSVVVNSFRYVPPITTLDNEPLAKVFPLSAIIFPIKCSRAAPFHLNSTSGRFHGVTSDASGCGVFAPRYLPSLFQSNPGKFPDIIVIRVIPLARSHWHTDWSTCNDAIVESGRLDGEAMILNVEGVVSVFEGWSHEGHAGFYQDIDSVYTYAPPRKLLHPLLTQMGS